MASKQFQPEPLYFPRVESILLLPVTTHPHIIQVPQDKMIPLTIVFRIVRGIILSRGTCSGQHTLSLPSSRCTRVLYSGKSRKRNMRFGRKIT